MRPGLTLHTLRLADDVRKKRQNALIAKVGFSQIRNDNLIFFVANRNYRMWSVLTTMCGGRVDGLKPLTPNSIIRR